MKRRTAHRIATGTALVALAFAGAALSQAHESVILYELRDLGSLGGENVMALGMNEQGMVVGWAEVPSPTGPHKHAFVWSDRTGMVDLGLPGPSSAAHDINVHGQIVGTYMTPENELHAFYAYGDVIYDLNEVLEPPFSFERRFDDRTQGHAPGGLAPNDECNAPFIVFTDALSINDDGTVVGCGFTAADADLHGYVMFPVEFSLPVPEYTYIDLGVLEGADDCVPYSVNGAEQVVGVSGQQAFFWENGVMAPLNEGASLVYSQSQANAINADGTAVGWVVETDLQSACVWAAGHRTDLFYLPGWGTVARDVNVSEQIVGWGEPIDAPEMVAPDRVPILWEGDNAVDLNNVTAIPVRELELFAWSALDEAVAIDDTGRIAGFGHDSHGRIRSFILMPLGR